jgi:hypothetical protein
MMVSTIGFAVAGCLVSPAWAQFPEPEVTKEHKILKRDVGVWEAEMKMWSGGPDSEPMVAKGMERNRMLGEIWLITSFEGELGGQKFIGHGMTGYNPAKEKFVGTWIDNMETHINHMEGTYDEKADELTMIMTGIDPATKKETKAKTVTRFPDRNTRVFTMFMAVPGEDDGWVKSMEINYKRRPRGGGKKK